MKRSFALILGGLLLGGLSAAQEDEDPFLRWLNNIAQSELQARENCIARIHTVAEAERRKKVVRKKLLDILGGLPHYDGPLHARVQGQIQADGYVIEKIIYETLPGFYVTANLYRPSRPGRYPAVLLQAGHTQEGKVEPQLAASNFALKGFIALTFDPIGQGEREQTYDPQLKGAAAGWSVPEHLQGGAQNLMLNQSLARYFIWDAKRSLDYLMSRPDVDPNHVGAAGCSGGGALTTFIGALDPRLKAVIPACFPVSYRVLFAGPDPDSEMAWPRFLAENLDTADFVEQSAPTPWLIQETEKDYFTPAGARMVYEEAKRWYKLYGAEDKVGFFVGPGPHGTPLVSREAVYRWMIRWLKNGQGDYHEQPVKLLPIHDLLVTKTGHVDDLPGSRKLYQLLLDDFKAKERPRSIAELETEMQRLKIPTDHSAPSVKVIRESDSGRRLDIQFESDPGIELKGKLWVPAGPGRKPAVLLVNGKLSDWLAPRMAAMGRVVLEFEPRGSVLKPADRRPFLGNWIDDVRANQVGLNLPSLRAHDILRAVDLLAARSDVDAGSIRAAAQDVKGIWLLLAAAADPRIEKIWLDKTPYSLREALHNTMNNDLFDAVIPGFVLHWDLDDLRKAMQGRPVLWTDPSNWMGRLAYAGPSFRYRYALGDLTDMADQQDEDFMKELLN